MLSVDWYVRNIIKHVHPVSNGNSQCRLGAARHSSDASSLAGPVCISSYCPTQDELARFSMFLPNPKQCDWLETRETMWWWLSIGSDDKESSKLSLIPWNLILVKRAPFVWNRWLGTAIPLQGGTCPQTTSSGRNATGTSQSEQVQKINAFSLIHVIYCIQLIYENVTANQLSFTCESPNYYYSLEMEYVLMYCILPNDICGHF